MSDKAPSVTEVFDRLEQLAQAQGEVSAGALVDSFGSRSYAPFLILPALLEISPVGGIPGVPSVLAAIVILFAVQMLLGRKHVWLPKFVAKRRFGSERLCSVVQKMRPLSLRLDKWFHGRLPALTRGPVVRLAAVVCILLALTVPPLEFIPFASTGPMAAIAMFGLALLVHDGALMIGAILLAVGAIALGIGVLA